jgi:hypothetical protein
MNSIRSILQKKIDSIHQSDKQIRKIFRYGKNESVTGSKKCFDEILNYLENNSDNIEDFGVNYWVDPENFSNVICLNIIPTQDIMKKTTPYYELFNITSKGAILDSLREHIQNIFLDYEWKFNNKTELNEICDRLSKTLGAVVKEDKSSDSLKKGALHFIVVEENGKEYTLESYIKKISKNGRDTNVGNS